MKQKQGFPTRNALEWLGVCFERKWSLAVEKQNRAFRKKKIHLHSSRDICLLSSPLQYSLQGKCTQSASRGPRVVGFNPL